MPADASLPLRAAAWGRAGQAVSGALFLVARELLQLFLVVLIDPNDRHRQPLEEGVPVLHAPRECCLQAVLEKCPGVLDSIEVLTDRGVLFHEL